MPTQVELGQQRSRELEAGVLRVFTDAGRSAFKESNRRTFEASIEFAVAMQATYFIVWSSSRFARNRFEAVYYKRELDRAGVQLVYLSSTIDRKTDDGWLLDSMLEIVDEMTSRQNAKDTRRSMIRNAQHGYYVGGRTPYGYRAVPAEDDPKRKRLVPNPAEAFIVRRIFERRAAGIGAKSIAMELTSAGHSINGRPWTKQTVLYLLKATSYIGRTTFNRRTRTNALKPQEEWVVVDSHEPLVSVELFDQVQQMIGDAADMTKGSPKSRHPFTGILRCGVCGEALQIETANGNGGQYAYYNCRSALQGVRCPGQRIRADEVDEVLSTAILDRVLSPENMAEAAREIHNQRQEWSRERDTRRRDLLGTIQTYQKRNSALYDLLELHGRDAPNLGDLTSRLRSNNAAMKEAEAQLAALDVELSQPPMDMPAIEALGDFFRGALLDTANAAKAREFYRGFIERIVLREDEAEIHYDPARLLAQSAPVLSTVKWRPELDLLRTKRVLRVTLNRRRGEHWRARRARTA